MKLTKQQNVRYQQIAEQLNEAREELRAAVNAYNLELRAAEDFARTVAEYHRERWEARSDDWRESDAGQQAEAFVDAWEAYEIEEFDEPEEGDFEELPMESEDV